MAVLFCAGSVLIRVNRQNTKKASVASPHMPSGYTVHLMIGINSTACGSKEERVTAQKIDLFPCHI